MKRLNMVMNGQIIGHLDQDDHGKTTLTAPPGTGQGHDDEPLNRPQAVTRFMSSS